MLDIWHVPVPVADLERSVAFYCERLGFRLVGRDEYEDKRQAFVVVRPGGFCLELFEPKDGIARRLPDHVAFECRDLAAMHARLRAGGLDVPDVATFDNGVRYLPLVDPDGLELELFEGRARYEAAIDAAGPIAVRPFDASDRAWLAAESERLYGAAFVVSLGVAHRPAELAGLVALQGGRRVGVASFRVAGTEAELVTIDALDPGHGVGTALLAEFERTARAAGCRRAWLVTTNDNLDALRFYQRRGWALAALHSNALARSRELKPAIPAVGLFGIPLRDELVLARDLG